MNDKDENENEDKDINLNQDKDKDNNDIEMNQDQDQGQAQAQGHCQDPAQNQDSPKEPNSNDINMEQEVSFESNSSKDKNEDDFQYNKEEENKEEEIKKQEEEQEQEEKEIMPYINFRRNFKQTREVSKTLYLIDKDWLNKWKAKNHYRKYKPQHSFYYYKNNHISSYEGDLPEINNESIIIPPSTYLTTLDDTTPIVNPDALRNIKYVNEEIWTALVNKYKGGPTIPFTLPQNIFDYQKSDLVSIKVTFIILPLRSEISPMSIDETTAKMKEYSIYSEKMSTLDAIKKKISRVIIDNKLLGNDSKITNFTDDSCRLWLNADNTTLESIQQSYKSKVEDIAKESNALLDISSNFGLLCLDGFMMSKVTSLFNEKKELYFCFEYSTETTPFLFKNRESLKMDQCEYNRAHGLMTVCCPCREVWYCNQDCLERDRRFHEPNCTKQTDLDDDTMTATQESVNGLCGLGNLGNTCFMNTGLQCLSNCPQLTEYFLSNKYQTDINEDNPLGTKGIMAKAYANLLKNLWYGTTDVFTPQHFKRSLGRYLKMFSGYNQHDTQEFLNYLLDTLHEDLNKVLKKPIVERDDSNLPDEIKSKSHWVSFLKRNQSVLVDLLYGQFKSTLICPDKECGNISITFDPFLSISLPLVSKSKVFNINCFFIFYDIQVSPLFFTIPFYSDTTFMALRNKIAEMFNIHPWSFVIVKMEDNNRRIDKLILETQSLHSFRSYDTPKYFIFQLDPLVFYSQLNNSIFTIEDSSVYQKDFDDSEEYINSRQAIVAKVYSRDYEETSRNDIKDTSNNCMSTDFICTVIKMMNTNEDTFIFPRVIFLLQKLNIMELYLYIYKTYHYIVKNESPFNKPGRSPNEIENDMLQEYQKTIEDCKDEMAFNTAIENKSLPFYIIYCPKDNSHRNIKLFPFNTDSTVGDYVNKFNEEPECYYYMSNKMFTLGIVWNGHHQKLVNKTLNNYKEPSIRADDMSHNRSISIYECFNRFSKMEVLGENNEWYCPKCKEHRRASKKIDIYKTPNVLIIHLKRFNNNSKIDTLIDFPIRNLDISKYVISNSSEEDTKYDLFAIGNHYGNMGFGHYIAFAKNHLNGQWYEFDDSRVSRKSEKDLVDSSAYVLFYAKQGINMVDWKEIYEKKFVDYNVDEGQGTNGNGNGNGNGNSTNTGNSNENGSDEPKMT